MNVLEGDAVAQLAHAGWGAFLVLAFGAGFKSFVAVLILAALKEILEATGKAFWEPRQSYFSSFIDFVFWTVGASLGIAVAALQKLI